MVTVGLMARDVRSIIMKQKKSMKSGKGGKYRKTLDHLMGNKLRDRRRDGDQLRKERRALRTELGTLLTGNTDNYKRIMKKLKTKVERIKVQLKKKNKDKVEKGKEDIAKLQVTIHPRQ